MEVALSITPEGQAWVGLKPNLVLLGDALSEVGKFRYLGGHMSLDGHISDVMSLCVLTL